MSPFERCGLVCGSAWWPRMIRRGFPSEGRFCVLDIETAPADELLAIGDARGGSLQARAALHAVVAVSYLMFDRSADGAFERFRLRSLDTDDMGEADLLLRLDRDLSAVHRSGGGLISFNGAAHDLPMLERRASRHWLFGSLRYSAWREARSVRHLDYMRVGVGCAPVTGGRWPNLMDACAAFGIDASMRRSPLHCALGRPSLKAEVDVVSTFLLHLYSLSADAGSATPLVNGWTALSRYLASPRMRADHLLPFARHPHVKVAQRLAQQASE